MGVFFPGHGSFSTRGLSWHPPHSLHPPAAARGDTAGAGDPPAKPRQFKFSVKAAATSGALALLGDTVAQLRSRWIRHKALFSPSQQSPTKALQESSPEEYDWIRSLRMTSYGFLIYGPASQVWYEVLDCVFWEKTLKNLSIKVALNQVVLGPFVIAVVFAWNSLWQRKLDKLPALYHDHAVSTLVDGWKFWIPASVLNFGIVPLQARVAFMSSCSIFWNFYLSTTMSKS